MDYLARMQIRPLVPPRPWPEGMDWNDAKNSGDIELFNFY